MSVLFADYCWLLIRSVTPNTLEVPHLDYVQVNPKTQYLEANSTMLRIFEAFFGTAFITAAILFGGEYITFEDHVW